MDISNYYVNVTVRMSRPGKLLYYLALIYWRLHLPARGRLCLWLARLIVDKLLKVETDGKINRREVSA
jgi:hypothetical protein